MLKWKDRHVPPLNDIYAVSWTNGNIYSTAPPKVWEWFVDVPFIIKRTHLENFVDHINILHQSIKLSKKGNEN